MYRYHENMFRVSSLIIRSQTDYCKLLINSNEHLHASDCMKFHRSKTNHQNIIMYYESHEISYKLSELFIIQRLHAEFFRLLREIFSTRDAETDISIV